MCGNVFFLPPDNRMKESGREGRMDKPDRGGGGTRGEGMSGHGLGYLGQRCVCVCVFFLLSYSQGSVFTLLNGQRK